MIKRIFSWFFCNLYYFYAKKKRRDADIVIINYIGVLMAWPVMIIAMLILFMISNSYVHKGEIIITLICVMVPFLVLFNRIFYKSKRYLRLLEKFPEENYNRYIFFYAILFFLILPGGALIAIKKLFL